MKNKNAINVPDPIKSRDSLKQTLKYREIEVDLTLKDFFKNIEIRRINLTYNSIELSIFTVVTLLCHL